MEHNYYDPPAPPPRKELQGPRPTPLNVRKESHKITKKPPVAPPLQQIVHREPPQPPPRQPVIIYTVSPKVIHTNPNDFMTLVQRLTGPHHATSSSSASSSSSGAISPAARLASIEKTKMPLEGNKLAGSRRVVEGEMVEISGNAEMDRFEEKPVYFPTGILSPGPGSLPSISPISFSPLFNDSNNRVNFLNHDINMVQQYGGKNIMDGNNHNISISPFSTTNNILVSPNTMFSPSSLDLLYHVLNNSPSIPR